MKNLSFYCTKTTKIQRIFEVFKILYLVKEETFYRRNIFKFVKELFFKYYKKNQLILLHVRFP